MNPLLILDLDETLVHANEDPLPIGAGWRIGPYHVYKRPHVDTFLSSMAPLYRLAAWTSSGIDYAAELIPKVFAGYQLEFAWDTTRCTVRTNIETGDRYRLKNLKKVFRRGYDKHRTLIVDDTPEKVAKQYGNHIQIREFTGDMADCELRLLALYLHHIHDNPDFRSLDKRGWRSQATGPLSAAPAP